MKKNKKTLIEQGQISALSALTFEQHIDNSSEKGFVDPLDSEEETLVIQQMLASGDTQWQDFVKRYFQHYPPSNDAANMLVDNVFQNSFAAEVLEQCADRYGFFPAQAERLCKLFLASKKQHDGLLEAICKASRVMSKEVESALEHLEIRVQENNSSDSEPRYAERYRKSIADYRASRM